MPTILPSTNAVTQPALPPQLFVGTDRTIAVIIYCIVSTLSLTLHGIFCMGVRRLCGWKSDFSFTLLLCLSLVSSLRFLMDFIASITSLFYMDFNKYQTLWIIFGSISYAPYFTVVVLNLAIALHRLLYTAYPFTASNIVTETTAKVILSIIPLSFTFFLTVLNTELMGVRWVDSLMSWTSMKSRNALLFRIINRMSNFFVGVLSLVLYSTLICVLVYKKMISFRRNHEIKMTLQVICMVVSEILFFTYWELFNMEGYGSWDLVIAEVSNLLYFDAIILPYIILNRKIHDELKRVLGDMKKASPFNSFVPTLTRTAR
ncbi:hypothetical protein Q1695_002368 [Nippostrongylus brasiliensis]|nr:hypothetical protein Q1695_002368 [Nippostrongylus brasiliensis]